MDPTPQTRGRAPSGWEAVIAGLVDGAADPAQATEVLYIVLAMAPHPPAQPTRDSRLIEDLGYDSLRLIELSVALEERFGTQFEPEVVGQIRTLREVVDHVGTVAGREG